VRLELLLRKLQGKKVEGFFETLPVIFQTAENFDLLYNSDDSRNIIWLFWRFYCHDENLYSYLYISKGTTALYLQNEINGILQQICENPEKRIQIEKLVTTGPGTKLAELKRLLSEPLHVEPVNKSIGSASTSKRQYFFNNAFADLAEKHETRYPSASTPPNDPGAVLSFFENLKESEKTRENFIFLYNHDCPSFVIDNLQRLPKDKLTFDNFKLLDKQRGPLRSSYIIDIFLHLPIISQTNEKLLNLYASAEFGDVYLGLYGKVSKNIFLTETTEKLLQETDERKLILSFFMTLPDDVQTEDNLIIFCEKAQYVEWFSKVYDIYFHSTQMRSKDYIQYQIKNLDNSIHDFSLHFFFLLPVNLRNGKNFTLIHENQNMTSKDILIFFTTNSS
jgi:hypothetical protein